jgi:hypothetical protein
MANVTGPNLSKLVFDKPWAKDLRVASLALEAGCLLAEKLREDVGRHDESLQRYQGTIIGLTAQLALQHDEDTDTYRIAASEGSEGAPIALTGSFEGLAVFDRESWAWEVPECPYDQLEVCLVVEPLDDQQHFLVAARHIIGYVATPTQEASA